MTTSHSPINTDEQPVSQLDISLGEEQILEDAHQA